MACCGGCFAGIGYSPQPIVQLNVGGAHFTTSRLTIQAYPDSVLSQAISGPPGKDGVYFLDYDGSNFSHILNFLREGDDFCMPAEPAVVKELIHISKRLRIPAMTKLLEKQQDAAKAQRSLAYCGAAIPENEVARLGRLSDLQVMHTDQDDRRFNSITRAVASILDVPIALVSLVGQDIQWFKSKVGLEADSTPRNTSFCAFMLHPPLPQNASMFVVEDAQKDDRVADNPLVVGPPYIRFYAGAPLQTSDGFRMGALCCIDTKPRSISSLQAQVLINFAQLTVQELERQQLLSDMCDDDMDDLDMLESCDFSAGGLRKDRMREALDEPLLAVWACTDSLEWTVLYANSAWEEKTGTIITPSARFPAMPTVSGACGGFGGRVMSLWKLLRIGQKEARDLWTYVRGDRSSNQGGPPRHFAIDAAVPASSWGGNPTDTRILRVSCRFSPAELPLDAGAAVVRPYGGESRGAAHFRLNGFPPGRLYFVTIVGGTVLSQKELLQYEGLASGVPSRPAPSPVAARRNSCPPSIDVGSDPTNSRSRSNNNVSSSNSISALASMKPPKSPFEDVKLIRILESGSMAKVYFGLWSGSPVGVKVIQTKQSANHSESFEGCLSATMLHPNVVQTYKQSTRMQKRQKNIDENDVDPAVADTTVKCVQELPMETFQETWIVQEWCDGGALDLHCRKFKGCLESAQSVREVLEICLDITSAGSYLHGRGIMHGDLCAKNVLIKKHDSRRGYICKVSNFGFAQIVDEQTQQTHAKSIASVAHMPPEVFKGKAGQYTLSPAVDVYAFGITIWQVCSGVPPYEGYAAEQIAAIASQAGCSELEIENEQIKTLFLACTRKEPSTRPSFERMAAELCELQTVSTPDNLSANSVRYRSPQSAPVL